jgi:trans-2,3-dihydro-3-hydroxyanthranilate isomerase
MKNSKSFVIADVFAEQKFGGNQLAVFTDGSGLDSSDMQNIAREMNYSETTFLFPAEQGGDYRVKIFTPVRELPFAGHPLVGSGYVIVAERMKTWSDPLTAVDLETGVGVIKLEVVTEAGRLGRSTMTQPLPEFRGVFTDIERLAKALALDLSSIKDNGLPVETAFNGIAVLLVPVRARRELESIKVDTGALERISNEVGASTVLVFARDTVLPESTVHCRVFAPAAGVIEDAATGSANGPLGAYLVRHKIVEAAPVARIISEQGFEMKRPSLLYIDVETDSATKDIAAVRVGGGVVISGRGEIFVD